MALDEGEVKDRVRRCALVLIAALVGLAFMLPAVASAKELSLPQARVVARIQPDGAVEITEFLTYSFSGSFSGGYREIPLRAGETISGVSVREGEDVYAPGAPTELGSSGAPSTFGSADLGDRTRIVWHYRAQDEARTFEIRYRITGLVVAHDDVGDLVLEVWGEEWSQGLDRLKAKVILPGSGGESVRVWGHPATVEGYTELLPSGKGATLFASYIPPHQWVEMRVVFPRSLLTSTTGAKTRPGDGFDGIFEEETAALREAEEQRERWEAIKRNLWWLIPIGLFLAALPGLSIAYLVWRRHGREPKVPDVGQHIVEPPGTEPPALVAALLEPSGTRAKADAFTATLFDLIRRKHLEAIPTTTERRTWPS